MVSSPHTGPGQLPSAETLYQSIQRLPPETPEDASQSQQQAEAASSFYDSVKGEKIYRHMVQYQGRPKQAANPVPPAIQGGGTVPTASDVVTLSRPSRPGQAVAMSAPAPVYYQPISPKKAEKQEKKASPWPWVIGIGGALLVAGVAIAKRKEWGLSDFFSDEAVQEEAKAAAERLRSKQQIAYETKNKKVDPETYLEENEIKRSVETLLFPSVETFINRSRGQIETIVQNPKKFFNDAGTKFIHLKTDFDNLVNHDRTELLPLAKKANQILVEKEMKGTDGAVPARLPHAKHPLLYDAYSLKPAVVPVDKPYWSFEHRINLLQQTTFEAKEITPALIKAQAKKLIAHIEQQKHTYFEALPTIDHLSNTEKRKVSRHYDQSIRLLKKLQNDNVYEKGIYKPFRALLKTFIKHHGETTLPVTAKRQEEIVRLLAGKLAPAGDKHAYSDIYWAMLSSQHPPDKVPVNHKYSIGCSEDYIADTYLEDMMYQPYMDGLMRFCEQFLPPPQKRPIPGTSRTGTGGSPSSRRPGPYG